jgi:hypothetical protein
MPIEEMRKAARRLTQLYENASRSSGLRITQWALLTHTMASKARLLCSSLPSDW